YTPADVPAGQARHRLPGPGSIGVSQIDGGGEYSRGPGDARLFQTGTQGKDGPAHRRVQSSESEEESGYVAVRWRAPQDGDSPGVGRRSQIRFARRTLRRC